ncbi:RsmB/NOP family class I SAM-dependent RNA methyltransferase [Erythrobacter litoralis]|uniref:RsmB/NOP family class I SAM-dependent RNA methyltransferase n=1 Tax=Erythrobacter litoralis TaxID=39960 RepID=UPI002435CF14|nr:RsmB/NOP family class I SAM-dependent RNA methyltransferase [Erythrobacter litoralis]MDG6078316.1 RsmB/NOP family class I SAM-dependent RNA methyltransferase [Erythrobacter litoralis]
MTPAARVQTAIELLDRIIASAREKGPPADRILADWFKNNRFAGSKDRRAIRELVYGAVRACGPVPENGRAAMLRYAEREPALADLFDGSQYGPTTLSDDEPIAAAGVAPEWLEARLQASGIEEAGKAALLDRAPLDIRVNALKANRASLILPEQAEPTAAPHGLRLETGTKVEQWDAYRDGLIEIQDTGSQLACLAVGAKPGETIVDLCAGGGGKTLSLAAAMHDTGRLIASDTDRGRISRLQPRAGRAGATIVETRLLDPNKEAEMLADLVGAADAVLIDAPCSGTGTWRRNPEARWRLDEVEIARLVDLQARLLNIGAQLVKPGGRLIYVVCSLLDEEGRDQFAAFLARSQDYRPSLPDLPGGAPRGEGIRLTPSHDGTDGFFIARAERS